MATGIDIYNPIIFNILIEEYLKTISLWRKFKMKFFESSRITKAEFEGWYFKK